MNAPEIRPRAVTFINGAGVGPLRMSGSRIACLADAGRDELQIDLRGDRVLPGLINAHEHLQLNNLPPLEAGPKYRHAREWIRDVDGRRRADPAFEALVARPRNDRLLAGAIKNLLSGATTVAHHDPLYPPLSTAEFPVRVVLDCGWSHSLYIDGAGEVRDSCLRTPPDRPWIIHAAEGTGPEASREFDELETLGCLRANTLLVHGIALNPQQRSRLERAGAGLIWCPASNQRLFGQTAEVNELAAVRRVALGTDSRLSGSRDLLEELRIASESAPLSEQALEAMVTRDAAALLRLADRGALRVGCLADLLVLPGDRALSRTARADVRLVVKGGVPRYADEDLASLLAPEEFWTEVRVDGRPKMLARELADALAAAQCSEPGLELPVAASRAA